MPFQNLTMKAIETRQKSLTINEGKVAGKISDYGQ